MQVTDDSLRNRRMLNSSCLWHTCWCLLYSSSYLCAQLLLPVTCLLMPALLLLISVCPTPPACDMPADACSTPAHICVPNSSCLWHACWCLLNSYGTGTALHARRKYCMVRSSDRQTNPTTLQILGLHVACYHMCRLVIMSIFRKKNEPC